MSKSLVAYFSASGVTAKVAEGLSEVTSSDVFEIRPLVPYTTADLNWMDKNSRSSVEMRDENSRPEIEDLDIDMSKYDLIYLGFPIWWYVAPTIINTFLENFNLTGKTIVTFATSGGSGMGKTIQKLIPSAKGAKFVEGNVFKKSVSREELADFVSKLK